jgi:hypothetical protein
MRFKLICELSPTSAFGLPDGDVLVMPSPGGEVSSPAVHSRAGVYLGFGTVSQYRRLEARLETAFSLGDATARLTDNVLEIRFEAAQSSVALDVGQVLADRFLQHLALEYGRPFTALPRVLEDEAENPLPLPVVLWQGTVTVYDLTALEQKAQAAAARVPLRDVVLDKALEYYEHALYLSTVIPCRLPIAERTVRHLLAASFLSLWKALSAVVGDPSSDCDYQRRYRELGLEYSFFADTIEEIRRLRNEEDVAHYRLDSDGLDVVRQKSGMAKEAVKRVIAAYAEHLRGGKPSFRPTP